MKAELRKEYADTVEREMVAGGWSDVGDAHKSIRVVALACQELADRPPKELTNDEVDSTFDDMPGGATGFCREWGYRQFASAIIAAFLEKQREPQVVKFRAARHKASGELDVFKLDDRYREGAGWEWLEPAQEFEVRI